MYVINDKYKFILILFPKSGCSTLRLICSHLLFNNLDKIEQDIFLNKHSIHKFHNNIQTLKIPDMDNIKQYHVICVYRNTYERLVSMYLEKAHMFNTGNDDRSLSPVPHENKETFSKFIKYTTTHENLDIHYEGQIIPTCILPHINQYINIKDIKNELFTFNSDLRDQFLKIYNTTGNINSMHKRTDININLTYYNFNTDHMQLFTKNKSAPSYNLFYNNDIINQVYDFYKDEIYLFNIIYPWERKFTFICNTCTGSTLERTFNREYHNPFIGSIFVDDYDYLKFCKNFGYYLTLEPTFITKGDYTKLWYQQSNQERWLLHGKDKCDYIIMKLDDIEIHWIHEMDKNYLLEKYIKRRNRLKDAIPIFMWAEEHMFLNLTPVQKQNIIDEFNNLNNITFMALYTKYNIIKDANKHFISYPYDIKIYNNTNRITNNRLQWSIPQNICDKVFIDMLKYYVKL